MSSGERLISRIPGEGLGVIPYNPASSFDTGSASEFLDRNIKEVLATNALTRAAMIAQIVADPTELTDDSAALEAAIRAAITTGQQLRLNGVFYVNTPINIAVNGRRVDLANHGDMWIIGGPDLDAPVIKIANSATVGGTAARSVAIRVSGFQFDVSKAPYGVLNSVNCLNFSGFRDTIIDGCYFYHGEDYREGSAGGDAGLFTTSNRVVFKHNTVVGAPDLAVYASGSQTGTQDNISLLSEGNNYIKCANAIATKRNYRYLRSVGDHFDGCYNCITASPAGGTGDGQLCGSRVVVTGATFRNIIAKCFDPRSSSNWHGSGVISGTFGIDLDGATVANAAFIGIAGSENCSFDIVGEVEGATDSTHAAVRITTHLNSETGITSTSRGNTVRATVKGIYNGLLEFTPCEKNTVELNLSGVTNPVTMPTANLTRVTINNDGARSEITGNFDTTPNRAQFTGTIYTANSSLSLGAVGRTVQAQPAASAVQLALPTGAASGDNIDVMKIAGSGAGLVQIRNPANTTTLFNIADVGGTVQMRFNGTDWLPVERYVSDRVVTLVQTPAASIANPPAVAKTLLIDSADGLLKTKDSAGAVQAYALASDVAILEDTVETLALTASVEYPTIADGLAATTEGGYFVVRESGDNYATRYQKVGGVEVFDNALASKAGVEDAVGAVQAQVDGLTLQEIADATTRFAMTPADRDNIDLSLSIGAAGGAPFRATFAEAIADFAVGEYFTSSETGELRTYKRVVDAPYYEDQGDAAAPVSEARIRRDVYVVQGATSSVDSYPLIAAAVAKAKAAGGGTVVLPHIGGGGYRVSEVVVVDFDDCTILVDDDVSLTKTTALAAVGPDAASASGVNGISMCVFAFLGKLTGPTENRRYIKRPRLIGLRKIRIDGNGSNCTDYTYSVGSAGNHLSVLFFGTINAECRNIYAYNGLVGCVTTGYSPGAIVEDCDASHSVYDNGIYSLQNMEHLAALDENDPATWGNQRIINCRAWECRNHGIGSFGSVGTVVVNPKIWNCGNNTPQSDGAGGYIDAGPAGGLGIEYNNSDPLRNYHFTAINPEVTGSYGFGIRTNCKGTRIIGGFVRGTKLPTSYAFSSLYDTWGHGIFVQSGADAVIECDTEGNARDGIYMIGETHAPSLRYKGRIAGNERRAITGFGVALLDMSTDCSVIGNGTAGATPSSPVYAIEINNSPSNTDAGTVIIAGRFDDNLIAVANVERVALWDLSKGIRGHNNLAGYATPGVAIRSTGVVGRAAIANILLTNANALTGRLVVLQAASYVDADIDSVNGQYTNNTVPSVDLSALTPNAIYSDHYRALGGVAPTFRPLKFGQKLIDTSGSGGVRPIYFATGVSDPSDWARLN